MSNLSEYVKEGFSFYAPSEKFPPVEENDSLCVYGWYGVLVADDGAFLAYFNVEGTVFTGMSFEYGLITQDQYDRIQHEEDVLNALKSTETVIAKGNDRSILAIQGDL